MNGTVSKTDRVDREENEIDIRRRKLKGECEGGTLIWYRIKLSFVLIQLAERERESCEEWGDFKWALPLSDGRPVVVAEEVVGWLRLRHPPPRPRHPSRPDSPPGLGPGPDPLKGLD